MLHLTWFAKFWGMGGSNGDRSVLYSFNIIMCQTVSAVSVGTFTALCERNAKTDMSYVGLRGLRHASSILPFFVVLKYHSFSTHFQNPKTKISTPNQEHITREIFLFPLHTYGSSWWKLHCWLSERRWLFNYDIKTKGSWLLETVYEEANPPHYTMEFQ
mgnify:CR=1 FL=1